MANGHEREVTLVNELGMHLRAAGRFVQCAAQYQSEISIEHQGVEVDGKSIMGILSLAAPCGRQITVSATGPDAEQALDALVELVERGFYEED